MLLCADTEELLHFVQISIASTSGRKQDLQERANRFSHSLHHGKVGSSQKVSQVAQRRSVAQATQHPRNFFSLRAGLLSQLQHCFCPLDCIITTSNVSGSGSAEAVGWDTNRNASQKSYGYVKKQLPICVDIDTAQYLNGIYQGFTLFAFDAILGVFFIPTDVTKHSFTKKSAPAQCAWVRGHTAPKMT